MNLKSILPALFFMSIVSMLLPYNIQATEISVGSPVIVARPEHIEPVLNQINGSKDRAIDAPLTTFVSGGIRYWLNSLGSETHKYKGSLDQPFQTLQWNKQSQIAFKDPLNKLGGPWRKMSNGFWTYDGGAPWIVNLYQVTDKELLAILHIEQAFISNTGYTTGRSSLGLAWSTDGGDSFSFLGDIIQYNTGYAADFNVQGAPYLIKDGYMYLYYHDVCVGHVTTVARAPLSEIIASARQGKTSAWHKYSRNWETLGLGGGCSKVNIETGIDHTDAAYSTHTGKYYLLLSRGAYGPGIDTWIKMYESSDVINWTFVKNIVQEPYPSEGKGYQYVNIVGTGGADNGVVGKSFYVYSAKNIKNASVYRWLVTLENNTSTVSGDLTGDGKVDLFDYNKLLAGFGTTYTIFDYNTLIANYGR